MPFEVYGTTAVGNAVTSLTRGAKGIAGAGAVTPGVDDFASKLGNLVGNVEQASADANVAVTNMVEQNADVHEAMIALQRAEMTLQLTVQIRNKLVQAYQDIMRMPV